jgi:hypothetical protein
MWEPRRLRTLWVTGIALPFFRISRGTLLPDRVSAPCCRRAGVRQETDRSEAAVSRRRAALNVIKKEFLQVLRHVSLEPERRQFCVQRNNTELNLNDSVKTEFDEPTDRQLSPFALHV